MFSSCLLVGSVQKGVLLVRCAIYFEILVLMLLLLLVVGCCLLYVVCCMLYVVCRCSMFFCSISQLKSVPKPVKEIVSGCFLGDLAFPHLSQHVLLFAKVPQSGVG